MHIATDLNASMMMQFPRHYFTDADDKQDTADNRLNSSLHIFVNASTQSYGVTGYICKRNHSLVMAKNRLAPLTLPKTELIATVIGARLSQHL